MSDSPWTRRGGTRRPRQEAPDDRADPWPGVRPFACWHRPTRASSGWPPSPAPRAPLLETGLERAAWSQTPKKGGTLTVGINTDIVSLDPNDIVFANVPMFFQLYDYLVTFGTNLEPQPSLAESWELAKDGTSATFKLRENVRTHSGGTFDADALLANFQRVKDKATGGGLFSRLEDFTAADKLDARTVRFRFARPRPDFLAMVSRWGMVDPAAFATAQAEGRRNRAVQARRVGSRRPPDVRPERQLLAARTALPRPGRLPGAERRRRDGERVPRGPDRRGPHDSQQGRPAAQGRGPAGPAGPGPQRVLRRHPQHAEAALRQPAGPAGDAVPPRSRDHREDDPGRHRQGAGPGGRTRDASLRPEARRGVRLQPREGPGAPRASGARREGDQGRRARVDQHPGEPRDRSDHPGRPQEGRPRREPHHRRAVSLLPDLLRGETSRSRSCS